MINELQKIRSRCFKLLSYYSTKMIVIKKERKITRMKQSSDYFKPVIYSSSENNGVDVKRIQYVLSMDTCTIQYGLLMIRESLLK